jgi:hypothetical protein
VRVEAAFWLGLAGEDTEGLQEALAGYAATGPLRSRWACAASLASLLEARRLIGGPPETPAADPERIFRDAWTGTNPLHFFLAARETSFLPLSLMGAAVKPLLAAYRKTDRDARDLRFVAKAGLMHLFCMADGPAADKAAWIESGKVAGGLVTVWAGLAGVNASPGGDASVLMKLVGVASDPKRDPGDARAAFFLLRTWTGRRFGFHPWHRDRGHAREIAERWKAWILANLDRMEWNASEGRFQVD